MEIMAEVVEFIKPELLILIPVLWIIGKAIKCSDAPNGNIPVILGFIGITLAGLWVMGYHAVFTAIVQGVLVAGIAVYGHHLYKRLN